MLPRHDHFTYDVLKCTFLKLKRLHAHFTYTFLRNVSQVDSTVRLSLIRANINRKDNSSCLLLSPSNGTHFRLVRTITSNAIQNQYFFRLGNNTEFSVGSKSPINLLTVFTTFDERSEVELTVGFQCKVAIFSCCSIQIEKLFLAECKYLRFLLETLEMARINFRKKIIGEGRRLTTR